MATPSRVNLNFVAQDNRGFKSRIRITAHVDDIDTVVADLSTFLGDVSAVGTALQAATNAKIVSTGVSFDWDIAQEPSSETGVYQLVQQGLHLHFGDGNGLDEFITIPAPKDGLFITSASENLIVANPAASGITGLQTATSNFNTVGDGVVFALFFGGQLRQGKPRRRRVLQGA
jgi:hypothetical protein